MKEEMVKKNMWVKKMLAGYLGLKNASGKLEKINEKHKIKTKEWTGQKGVKGKC